MRTEKTAVIIPFQEEESADCLRQALRFADQNLANLAVDALAIVSVNGENTKAGRRPQLEIPQGNLNTDVVVTYAPEIGQAAAIQAGIELVNQRGRRRIFCMDADIYPFPHAYSHMWTEPTHLVGSNHLVYPLEIVEDIFGPLGEEERFFYRLFEVEKRPVIRQIISRHIPPAKTRIKGSLILVDTDWLHEKIGDKPGIIDSTLSGRINPEEMSIAEHAYFMHMGRISLVDHIRAIYRHYLAAESRGELESFANRQISATPQTVETIAGEVRDRLGKQDASLLLIRFAEHQRVHEICHQLAQDKPIGPIKAAVSADPFKTTVDSFAEAQEIADLLLANIDWEEMQSRDSTYETTLRELPRVPIEVASYLQESRYREITLDSMGLEDDILL